jgi:RNA polymerase sigma-70 factor (ECF subfamily)
VTTEWERDAALLEAWRNGDSQAGEQLFDRHADAVARFFENKVREGAEDLFREHLRTLARGRNIDPEVETMADLAPGPTTVASNKQEQRRLLEALRRLPVDAQIIVELYYWEELKTDDIAAVMDQVPSTVRGKLSKAHAMQVARAIGSMAGNPAATRP